MVLEAVRGPPHTALVVVTETVRVSRTVVVVVVLGVLGPWCARVACFVMLRKRRTSFVMRRAIGIFQVFMHTTVL
jgi:hypothetical protein